jgi:sulfonate transport system permease protein
MTVDDLHGDPEMLVSGPTLVREPGPAERDPVRKNRIDRTLEIGLAVAVPVVFLALWQAAAHYGWIDGRLYPTPQDIARAGWDQFAHGEVRHDTWVTMRRTLIGWSIGSTIGLAMGTLMGSLRLVRKALEPSLDALYVVPKLALLPILMNIFKLGEGPVIALVAVTVFFFVWISTMAAVMAVPAGYRETGAAFGVSRWQMFRHVTAPAAAPQVVVGLRVAAGVAVLVIVAAEQIAAHDGLGYLIFHSRDLFLNEEMYVGIVVVALFGVLFAEAIRQVGRWLTPWARDDGRRTTT